VEIGIQSGSEDWDEIQKQCDSFQLMEGMIGFHGLSGGVCVWTYEDATCEHWEKSV
jgi:hypothetical protein